MLDISPLIPGARLKRTSTSDLVDYLRPGDMNDSAAVIMPDGLIQDIAVNDLELVALA